MSNILVFLVMLCFSCSISFADNQQWDASKEKRYKEWKQKSDEQQEFDDKSQIEEANEYSLIRIAQFEGCQNNTAKGEDLKLCKKYGHLIEQGAVDGCQWLRENSHKPLPKTCNEFPVKKSDTNALTRNPFEN